MRESGQATVLTHRSRVNSTADGFDTSPEVSASSARFPSLVGTTLLYYNESTTGEGRAKQAIDFLDHEYLNRGRCCM